MSEITRTDDRYVLTGDDGQEIGYIEFHEEGGIITMPHTIVHPEFEGQGHAGRLAQFAMDDARDRGLQVMPSCSYLDAWLRRHPEYESLRAAS